MLEIHNTLFAFSPLWTGYWRMKLCLISVPQGVVELINRGLSTCGTTHYYGIFLEWDFENRTHTTRVAEFSNFCSADMFHSLIRTGLCSIPYSYGFSVIFIPLNSGFHGTQTQRATVLDRGGKRKKKRMISQILKLAFPCLANVNWQHGSLAWYRIDCLCKIKPCQYGACAVLQPH